MSLLEQIQSAGIVGCGGAGFPTHVKLNCTVEYLIVNGAECEPLLRTDRYLMKQKAEEIITAAELVGEQVQAKYCYIALKETYKEEIACLTNAIQKRKSQVSLFLLKNFYPAGDEQIMVCEVTGRTVPPSGIPLDVGTVVSNIATMYGIYEALNGIPFTDKFLTVTGAVSHPVIVHTPIGTPFEQCIQAAGGAAAEQYHILEGGPLMGKLYPKEKLSEHTVTKTTSGIVIVPDSAELVSQREMPLKTILKRAKGSCIQCSTCTQMCPRYLTGHMLSPHKIMRKLAYAQDIKDVLGDEDVKQAMTCSECGICETYACPMGLQPRQVNVYIKGELRKSGFRYEKPKEVFHKREDREYRRVPSKRIAVRLGVAAYYDNVINELKELSPERVIIPLQQHIGAPSQPQVSAGDAVSKGQLIGKIPEKSLGANIHASISGTVEKIENGNVFLLRK